ncbi:hypothetical protein FDT66_13850 [Polaribacter aestuariivivens]|uniref:Uncharacterized protein n=1 Tax=Polaribacter aestuariivivens TaxID=2304626 RepID=A0A5S3N0A8_9FLAO|nr:hypothetical protein [Polaribacter aestuariivivens]TMM28681.1 hypothetical protein FDT66_13850 [Polaribacter aestuariivivens]
MKKIILEYRFTNHQKITFLLYLGAPFLIKIFFLLRNNMHLNMKDYLILLLCVICYAFLISIAFLKRGFLKKNSNLYKGSFFLGKLFFKTRIDISEKSRIVVLKFRKSQKFAWFSDAKPDLAFEYNSFEINLLNARHTKRKPILDLKKKENVEPITKFLTSNFGLKFEKYNPNFK